MFGVTTIYIGNKILIGLRDKSTSPESNGLWIATSKEHHESLVNDLPSLQSIPVLGDKGTSWQMIAADDDAFEEQAIKVCEFIKKHDPRIGKITLKKRIR